MLKNLFGQALTSMTNSAVAVATYTKTEVRNLYVDAGRPNDNGDGLSWGTAKRTIQAGVDVAVDGDTVLVTNGIYNVGGAMTPSGMLPNRVVITNNIVVRSVNGVSVTIIQGSGTNAYDTANAMRCVYMTKGVLDGFTLRDGATVYSLGGSSAVNKEGGGACIGSLAWLQNCVISNCIASNGGGVSGIANNHGYIRNSLLVGNLATGYGGGAYYASVYNTTLVGNRCSGGYGGGVWFGSLFNSIAWGNVNMNGETDDTQGSDANYSCAASLLSMNGCINVPPRFVDEANGNYRLRSDSPCVDKGNNTYAPELPDMDGNARCRDGDGNGVAIADMGAYEYGSTSGAAVATPMIAPGDGTSFAGSLAVEISCATAGAEIRYTLDGSEPTTNSALYGVTIPLVATTTVKAKAFKVGQPDSFSELHKTVGGYSYVHSCFRHSIHELAGGDHRLCDDRLGNSIYA